MKVLLVTGSYAYPGVRRVAEELAESLGWQVDVVDLGLPVASLATPAFIARRLKGRVSGYDVAIVSGRVRGSLRQVAEELGVKVVKGTRNYADLPRVLEKVEVGRLSPDVEADVIYQAEEVKLVKELLSRSEREARGIRVGGLVVPLRPPPIRVALEVWGELGEVASVADRYDRFIDILVLGFGANSDVSDVRKAVRSVGKVVDKPLGVDAPGLQRLRAGFEAGADLLLSLRFSDLEKVGREMRSAAVVVVPETRLDKFAGLTAAVERAVGLGFSKVIADPILDPPVIPGSLPGFIVASNFKRRFPDIPVMLGVGNVSELMDADSVGVNALAVMLSVEAGASLLLTVEGSVKTRGSVVEVKAAATMATLALLRETYPKDLGVDMLVLKSKREGEEPPEPGDVVRVDVAEGGGYVSDPIGVFRVWVDHGEGVIKALYMGRKGRVLLVGRRALDILRRAVDMGLLSRMDHAGYLGYELGKAEEALRLGRSYVQDEPLFKDLRERLSGVV